MAGLLKAAAAIFLLSQLSLSANAAAFEHNEHLLHAAGPVVLPRSIGAMPSAPVPDVSTTPTPTTDSATQSIVYATPSGTADCNDPEACAEAANNDPNRVVCMDPSDCDAYCNMVIGSTPEVQQFGLATTCIQLSPLGTSVDDAPGACYCSSSEVADEALEALGEVVCIALDLAIPAAAEILSTAGTFSGAAEVKYAGKILSVGDKVFAQGTKAGDCPNAACPGHVFTQVDPTDLENQLGLLDLC